MRISGSARKAIGLFSAMFLLCGAGHVLLPVQGFTNSFSQFFCASLLIIWALSVQKRVTDRRIRTLLMWTAGFVMLYFIAQFVRYDLARGFPGEEAVSRGFWYIYYVDMMGTALLCYGTALRIHQPPESAWPAGWRIPGIPCLLAVGGILTNDAHQLAFRFRNGDLRLVAEYTYGPLYFFFVACFALVILSAYLIILRKGRRSLDRRYRLLPVIPILLMALFMVLNATGHQLTWQGRNVWNVGEIFGFCMIGFLETCIQLGLIPANRAYDELFRKMELPAEIRDRSGTPVIYAAGEWPIPEGENWEIRDHPISGGSVRWAVDLRRTRELNRELERMNRQMKARNEYLAEEAGIRQEKTEQETRNRLYDAVARLLRPQLGQINERLRQDGFENNLPRIAVLSAYVKRRSNMELLAAEGELPPEELILAIRETLEYVELCGVRTAVTAAGTAKWSPDQVTTAYESLEYVLESALDVLTDVMVAIRGEGDALSLRVLFRADRPFWHADGLPPVRGAVARSVSLSEDGGEGILSLRFAEGGKSG